MILCHVHVKIFSFQVWFLDIKDHFAELVRLENISVLTRSKIHGGFLRFICADLVSLLSSLPRRWWDEALGSQWEQCSWFFWILIVFFFICFHIFAQNTDFHLFRLKQGCFMIFFILSISGFASVVIWKHLNFFFFFFNCEEKQWERESLLDFFFQNTAKTLGFWAWQLYSNLIK